jgi:uncharacterized short protein YbdD (DUF466 family)
MTPTSRTPRPLSSQREAPPEIADALRAKAPLFAAFSCIWRWLWNAWSFLRQASGDDAYERYLEHMALEHPGTSPLSPAQYFRFRQDQKWNRITRCC